MASPSGTNPLLQAIQNLTQVVQTLSNNLSQSPNAPGNRGAQGARALRRGSPMARLAKFAVKNPLQALEHSLALLGPEGEAAEVALAAVSAAFEVVSSKIKEVISYTLEYGKAANPAQYKKYQMAQEDLNASIGRQFAPMLERLTWGMRALADIAATVGDHINLVELAFKSLYDVLNQLTYGVPRLVVKFYEIAKAAGLIRDSTGAAHRQTSYQGVEEYGRSINLAAYGSGNADPAKETAGNTGLILSAVTAIGQLLTGNFAAAANTAAIAAGS